LRISLSHRHSSRLIELPRRQSRWTGEDGPDPGRGRVVAAGRLRRVGEVEAGWVGCSLRWSDGLVWVSPDGRKWAAF
jgi:hypothetical protein